MSRRVRHMPCPPDEAWAIAMRCLRRAIRVAIVEQGNLPPFVPAADSRVNGHTHVGLIWGPVMRRGVFLPTSLTQNGGRWRRCFVAASSATFGESIGKSHQIPDPLRQHVLRIDQTQPFSMAALTIG